MRGIHVDLDGDVPVYRQIAGEIRALIARGELAADEELPSVRDLAGRIGVNLNTVAKAYRMLAEEGLVELRHGAGARVRLLARPYRAAPGAGLPPDLEHRLHDVLSRLVLDGMSRPQVEQLIGSAIDRFFGSRGPTPRRKG